MLQSLKARSGGRLDHRTLGTASLNIAALYVAGFDSVSPPPLPPPPLYSERCRIRRLLARETCKAYTEREKRAAEALMACTSLVVSGLTHLTCPAGEQLR